MLGKRDSDEISSFNVESFANFSLLTKTSTCGGQDSGPSESCGEGTRC